MRTMLLAAMAMLPAIAYAQAPAAGSGLGGGVAASGPGSNVPSVHTPPGTPGGPGTDTRATRDTVGQSVIGHTATPPSAVAGTTTGQDSGIKK